MPSPILVVIADSEPSSRDELRRILAVIPSTSLAAEASDYCTLLEAVRRSQPDFLLMASGFLDLQQARLIAERSFCTKLPAVTTYDCAKSISLTELLRSGIGPTNTRSDRNSLETLRTWSQALECVSGLPAEERVIIARIHGRLGLLFSSAILSIRESVPLPTLVTRWNDHEAVEGLDKVFSKDDPQRFFEAGSGTWIHVDRMGQLQKKIAAEETQSSFAPNPSLVKLVLVPKLRNQPRRYLSPGRNN